MRRQRFSERRFTGFARTGFWRRGLRLLRALFRPALPELFQTQLQLLDLGRQLSEDCPNWRRFSTARLKVSTSICALATSSAASRSANCARSAVFSACRMVSAVSTSAE
jgi:hypothetical protein